MAAAAVWNWPTSPAAWQERPPLGRLLSPLAAKAAADRAGTSVADFTSSDATFFRVGRPLRLKNSSEERARWDLDPDQLLYRQIPQTARNLGARQLSCFGTSLGPVLRNPSPAECQG